MTTKVATTYDERLTAPRSYWVIAALIGFASALIVFPYGELAALAGFALGTAFACSWVNTQGSSRIRIVGDLLVADDTRVPLAALGDAEILEGEEARAWRTYKADLRAHMLMRSFVSSAVRIEVVDPDDPTPYLYLSTRSPQALSDAIDAARAV
ncbi:DUF3093 domain-containing protein [Streptomyces cinereoruber]|uniref:DUF3093 domain-containing protein n=1 Tax=Streptomyces cinereoruber TaxID=67260 RepID=UPI003C2FF37A